MEATEPAALVALRSFRKDNHRKLGFTVPAPAQNAASVGLVQTEYAISYLFNGRTNAMTAAAQIEVTRGPASDRSSIANLVGSRDDAELNKLERLAYWLDAAVRVPGLGVRFGFDAVLDLIPGIGDAIGLLASLYIFQAARRFNIPRITLVRMALNIFIDYVGGLTPLVGAVFDAYWKANLWNVALLRRHLNAQPGAARKARRGDGLFVAGIIVLMLTLMLATLALVVWGAILLAGLLR